MQESGEGMQRISKEEAINLLNTLDPNFVQDLLRQKMISGQKKHNLSSLPEPSFSDRYSPNKVPSTKTPDKEIDATPEIQSVVRGQF